jgi:hypothetical protein
VADSVTCLYWHIANWFASNEPGTPVPEWCELSWPIREDEAGELILLYEKDTGLHITQWTERNAPTSTL